jgi:hypothetical protein
MADQEYVNSLVNFGRLTPSNVGQLEMAFACLGPKILRGDGRMVTSVTVPGETVVWGSLTLQDQFNALSQALDILHGTPTIIRRTTARYF